MYCGITSSLSRAVSIGGTCRYDAATAHFGRTASCEGVSASRDGGKGDARALPPDDDPAYQVEGGGGGTTGGRSSQVIVFGSSHGASQGPVVPPPSLPPRSVTLH